jgi:hypothetical protein
MVMTGIYNTDEYRGDSERTLGCAKLDPSRHDEGIVR